AFRIDLAGSAIAEGIVAVPHGPQLALKPSRQTIVVMIEKTDPLAACFRNRKIARFAERRGLIGAEITKPTVKAPGNLRRPIGRRVVPEDDFPVTESLRVDRFDGFPDVALAVQAIHDD